MITKRSIAALLLASIIYQCYQHRKRKARFNV